MSDRLFFFVLYFLFFNLHPYWSECSFFCTELGFFAALLGSGQNNHCAFTVSEPPAHFSNIVRHNHSTGMDSNFIYFSLVFIFLLYLTCSGHPANLLTFYILSKLIFLHLFVLALLFYARFLASPCQVQSVAVIGLGLSAQALPFFFKADLISHTLPVQR